MNESERIVRLAPFAIRFNSCLKSKSVQCMTMIEIKVLVLYIVSIWHLGCHIVQISKKIL